MIGFAILFAMQAAAQAAAPPPAPATSPVQPESSTANWPRSQREMRQTGVLQDANDPVTRRELESWAGCVARKNRDEAARVLSMDFTSGAYDRALRMLSEEDTACIGFRGSLRAAGLLFAGEMAESLLESDSTSLVSRLAKAGAAEPTRAYSFTDKVAICVVRSVPNDVAGLFGTERGSEEETARLEALKVPMAMCAKAAEAKRPIEVNPAGLRAMLATASFRSVASLEDA